MPNDPNNPYVRKPHRNALRGHSAELTDAEISEQIRKRNREFNQSHHRVVLRRSDAFFVARQTGSTVIAAPRSVGEGASYDVRTPNPQSFPYHPDANPHGTVDRFDVAQAQSSEYLQQEARRWRHKEGERRIDVESLPQFVRAVAG